LGQRITAARQDLGLDLKDLAERLCIGPEQLQALESANTSHLPELVFVIAQVRRVAASLGLDAEEAVAALRASAPARFPEANSPPARQLRASMAPAGRSPIPPRSRAKDGGGTMPAGGLLACIGLLLTAAVGLVVLWQRGAPDSQSTGQPSSVSPRAGSGAIPMARIPPSSAAAQALAPAGPALLVLRSREPSWLEVRNSEGATLFQGMLQGEKSYPLGQGLQVMAGRPDLVEIELAGQQPRVLGAIDQVIWRTFTAAPGSTADAAGPGASKAPAP
jgi:cytoskeletal protein RodZ